MQWAEIATSMVVATNNQAWLHRPGLGGIGAAFSEPMTSPGTLSSTRHLRDGAKTFRLHNRFTLIAAQVMVGLLAVLAAVPNTAQAGSKITICHIPPGNPANVQTIDVAPAALSAHLAHGDRVGPCASECQDPGETCTSDADCCGDLACTGSYKTCASNCTIGPELGDAACGPGLDCCDGACLYDTCWLGTTCHLPGTVCTDDPQKLDDLCCLGANCINGVCVLQ